MCLVLPTIRADFAISETYNYINEEPLFCPITALRGLNDDIFHSKDLLKWKEQTTNPFKYHFLAGDHFFIITSYEEFSK